MFFVFRNSLQKGTFCFPFCQTSAICIYPSMPSRTGFLVRAGVSGDVLISLSSDIAFLKRKSTVSFALVSVSTYFGSRFNSPKKNT